MPDWLVSYGSIIVPNPPTLNNQTQLPSLASLGWEPPADHQFLVSCLSLPQRSPLVLGLPRPCSPRSKSPSLTWDSRGTDAALLRGSCFLSHALPRGGLENVLWMQKDFIVPAEAG